MASDILQSLIDRVHLLQERPGTWADQDRIQTITELALELAQSFAELEDRLGKIETRPSSSAASTKPASKANARGAKAKVKAKPAKAAAKPPAKAKPAKKTKAKPRGKRR